MNYRDCCTASQKHALYIDCENSPPLCELCILRVIPNTQYACIVYQHMQAPMPVQYLLNHTRPATLITNILRQKVPLELGCDRLAELHVYISNHDGRALCRQSPADSFA